ncbi:hypothetical protein ACFX2J_020636 [Malus domestica]|nr:uncharacterized protein LOC103425553 [Malus domestica]
MAATPTASGFSPAVPSLSLPITNPNKPIWFFRPFSASKKIPTVGLSWSSNRGRNPVCSRISHAAGVALKRGHVVLAVSGLMSSISETNAELEPNNLNTDATIDIQLPRRSLLVKFTCNLCGERTNRLVNRLAYERGLIYVQCAGCQKYHKLADNLGLVVEYDLREDIDLDTNTDEV